MSKQYPKRSINGDAGEYFAAFMFTRLLRWPCRLQSIDLGIDAELEICDEQGAATGNVVKLQIKSFEKLAFSDKHDVYIDDVDIHYWQRFSVPTIIVCVDLALGKVYWKPIRSTEGYQSGGVSRKVTFELKQDELIPEARGRINALSSPDQFKDVIELIAQARLIYERAMRSDVLAISEDELEERQEEYEAPFYVHAPEGTLQSSGIPAQGNYLLCWLPVAKHWHLLAGHSARQCRRS